MPVTPSEPLDLSLAHAVRVNPIVCARTFGASSSSSCRSVRGEVRVEGSYVCDRSASYATRSRSVPLSTPLFMASVEDTKFELPPEGCVISLPADLKRRSIALGLPRGEGGDLDVALFVLTEQPIGVKRATFDCKRDKATNEVVQCHPIERPIDTARLQCALRPSQPPFTRCFMSMSCVLYPPRSPPQLQLPPIAEDAAGLLVHAFGLPPHRLHRLLADVRRRPHPVIMVFQV